MEFNVFEVLDWVWSGNGLDTGERVVLAVLCKHAGKHTGACWPSLPTIADESGFCEQYLGRVIRRLEGRGLVTIERGNGRGHSSTYHLHIPKKANLQNPLSRSPVERKANLQNPLKGNLQHPERATCSGGQHPKEHIKRTAQDREAAAASLSDWGTCPPDIKASITAVITRQTAYSALDKAISDQHLTFHKAREDRQSLRESAERRQQLASQVNVTEEQVVEWLAEHEEQDQRVK